MEDMQSRKALGYIVFKLNVYEYLDSWMSASQLVMISLFAFCFPLSSKTSAQSSF